MHSLYYTEEIIMLKILNRIRGNMIKDYKIVTARYDRNRCLIWLGTVGNCNPTLILQWECREQFLYHRVVKRMI